MRHEVAGEASAISECILQMDLLSFIESLGADYIVIASLNYVAADMLYSPKLGYRFRQLSPVNPSGFLRAWPFAPSKEREYGNLWGQMALWWLVP